MTARVTTDLVVVGPGGRQHFNATIHFAGSAPSPEVIRSGIGTDWPGGISQEELTRRLAAIFEARVVTVGHAGGFKIEIDSGDPGG
jgi:hypothetical protein